MTHVINIYERRKFLEQTIGDLEWERLDATFYKEELIKINQLIKEGATYWPLF